MGATFSPHLNLDLAEVAGGWNVGLLIGPQFADRRYNRQYYGVDAAYATPQRAAYDARGGYAGWDAIAATSRRFGNMWVGAFVRYDNLRGAVFEDSPLVRRNSGVTAGFGVSWVLDTSSELVDSPELRCRLRVLRRFFHSVMFYVLLTHLAMMSLTWSLVAIVLYPLLSRENGVIVGRAAISSVYRGFWTCAQALGPDAHRLQGARRAERRRRPDHRRQPPEHARCDAGGGAGAARHLHHAVRA